MDTKRMRTKLPERKRNEVLQLLRKWASTRKTATAKEMWSSAEKLRHVVTAMRPGHFFVWRFLF